MAQDHLSPSLVESKHTMNRVAVTDRTRSTAYRESQVVLFRPRSIDNLRYSDPGLKGHHHHLWERFVPGRSSLPDEFPKALSLSETYQ